MPCGDDGNAHKRKNVDWKKKKIGLMWDVSWIVKSQEQNSEHELSLTIKMLAKAKTCHYCCFLIVLYKQKADFNCWFLTMLG